MHFLVSGVDRDTGAETTVSINAANASEAESIASLSMLVAEVTPNPVADEASSEASVQPVPYAQRNLSSGFDWVTGILNQARVLRGLSWICAGFGVLGIVTTLLERFVILTDATVLAPLAAFGRALSPGDISGSILFLVGAGILRLTAHFAIGFRELLMKKLDQNR